MDPSGYPDPTLRTTGLDERNTIKSYVNFLFMIYFLFITVIGTGNHWIIKLSHNIRSLNYKNFPIIRLEKKKKIVAALYQYNGVIT